MRILTILTVMLACAVAHADATDDARKYFEAGKQAYEAGQYAASIAAFEEAYKLAPRPSVTFALAQGYRRQYSIDRDGGKLVRAGELYRKYLAEVKQGERREEATRYLGEIEPLLLQIEQSRAKAAPPPPQPTQVMISSQTKGTRGSIDGGALSEVPVIADVKPGAHKVHVEADGYFPADAEAIAVDGRLVVAELNLKEKPAVVSVKAVAGADVSVDGRVVGKTPLKGLELPAGKHFIAVSRRGTRGWTRDVTLERGGQIALDAPLERTTQRKLAYGVLVAAGVVALGGVATTAVSLSARGKANDLADKIDAGTATEDDLAEHNRLADRSNRFATASQILYGSAALIAVAGALAYYLDTPRVSATEGTVVPTVTASGAGAVYLRRF